MFVSGINHGAQTIFMVKCEENDDRKIRRIHEEIMNRVMDHLTTGVEDIIGYHGRHWWIHKIHEINAAHFCGNLICLASLLTP